MEDKQLVVEKEKPEIITGVLLLLTKNKGNESIVVRTEIELPNDKFSRTPTLTDLYRMGSELCHQVNLYEGQERLKQENKQLMKKIEELQHKIELTCGDKNNSEIKEEKGESS